jgi:type II secretory ATPase GspE/PulE/Tfp pilus assembly ATPase PilB-like protein
MFVAVRLWRFIRRTQERRLSDSYGDFGLSQSEECANSWQELIPNLEPARAMLSKIIAMARRDGARTIFIDIDNDDARIRFVVHEYAKEAGTLPKSVAKDIIGMLSCAAGCGDGCSGGMPTTGMFDGVADIVAGEATLSLNIRLIPSHPSGTHLEIRLPPLRSWHVPTLGDLGFTGVQERAVQSAIEKPSGLILVSGPEDAKLPVTLAAMVRLFPQNSYTYTFERAIEYTHPDVSQILVDDENPVYSVHAYTYRLIGGPASNFMVESVDAKNSAMAIMNLAQAGHRVVAGITAPSAIRSVEMLARAALSSDVFEDPNFIACLVNQRALPRLCPSCAINLASSKNVTVLLFPDFRERLDAALGSDYTGVQLRGKGCVECSNSGVIGDTYAAEAVYLDDEAYQFIRAGKYLEWETELRTRGWKPLREQILQLVRSGVVCPVDAEKNVLGVLSDAPLSHTQASA